MTMTYREMFDFLASKGVKVDFRFATECGGVKPEEGQEFLKYWMVRTRENIDSNFLFCCGFDLIGDGKVWISGREYPLDETVFDSLMDAIKRNYDYGAYMFRELPRPENILLVVDDCMYDKDDWGDDWGGDWDD